MKRAHGQQIGYAANLVTVIAALVAVVAFLEHRKRVQQFGTVEHASTAGLFATALFAPNGNVYGPSWGGR